MRVGDSVYTRDEAERALAMLAEVRGHDQLRPDGLVADLLGLIFTGVPAPGRVEAVAGIVASDYLGQRPHLRLNV